MDEQLFDYEDINKDNLKFIKNQLKTIIKILTDEKILKLLKIHLNI